MAILGAFDHGDAAAISAVDDDDEHEEDHPHTDTDASNNEEQDDEELEQEGRSTAEASPASESDGRGNPFDTLEEVRLSAVRERRGRESIERVIFRTAVASRPPSPSPTRPSTPVLRPSPTPVQAPATSLHLSRSSSPAIAPTSGPESSLSSPPSDTPPSSGETAPTPDLAQLSFLSGSGDQTTDSLSAGIARTRARLAHDLNAAHSPIYLLPDELLATIFVLVCGDEPRSSPPPAAWILSAVSNRFRHVALNVHTFWNRLTIHLPMEKPAEWLPGGKWRELAERCPTSRTLELEVRINQTMALAQAKGTHIPPTDVTKFVMSLFTRCRTCRVMGHHSGHSLLPGRTRDFVFPETDSLKELRMYDAVTKVSSILLLLSRCSKIENVHLHQLRVQSEPDPTHPSTAAGAVSAADVARAPVPDILTLRYLHTLRIDVLDSTGFNAHGLLARLVLPNLRSLHLSSSAGNVTLSTFTPMPESYASVRQLHLQAPRATLECVLRLICAMPLLQDLCLQCMVLESGTTQANNELMRELAPAVPPLKRIFVRTVFPVDTILPFLVGAVTQPLPRAPGLFPGGQPESYLAARRRRHRTLERLEIEGCWMYPATRTWLEQRAADGWHVRSRNVTTYVGTLSMESHTPAPPPPHNIPPASSAQPPVPESG